MERTNSANSNYKNKNTKDKTTILNQLPLSWIHTTKSISTNHIKLGYSIYWIYYCKISNISCISEFLDSFSKKPKTNFIIRGCNQEISKYLIQLKFNSLIIGKEAIIDLYKNPFSKKSLKELVKRGLKYGTVKEIKLSENSINNLDELNSHSAHSNEPQLKYLFINKFIPETRLFAFIDAEGIWQGAILISNNSPNKIQTELLLRRRSATNGTMETLIYFIYQVLRKENFTEWSLGEVPFIVNPENLHFLSKPYIINKIGRMLKYAYNYEGLYFFKNKFATRWENVYLCAKPKVKFRHIIMLSIRSNLLSLTLQKLLK